MKPSRPQLSEEPTNMGLPNVLAETLRPSVFAEPDAGNRRIVLWRRVRCNGPLGLWDRIATVSGAPIEEEAGVCTAQARTIRPQEPRGGVLGFVVRLWSPLRGFRWMIPN